MKKLFVFMIILILSVGFVFADTTTSFTDISEANSKSAVAPVVLDLQGENASSLFEFGFTSSVALDESTGLFAENQPTALADTGVMLKVNANGTASTKSDFYIYWKILSDKAVDLQIKTPKHLNAKDSADKSISWTLSLANGKQSPLVTTGTITEVTPKVISFKSENNEASDGTLIYRHDKPKTVYVDHGYLPVSIETETLNGKELGSYSSQITLMISST